MFEGQTALQLHLEAETCGQKHMDQCPGGQTEGVEDIQRMRRTDKGEEDGWRVRETDGG